MSKSTVNADWSARLAGLNTVRWLVSFVLVGAALYLAGMIWSGWGLVVASFARLGFVAFALGAVVASLAYLVRFGRWHFSLLLLGNRISPAFNLKVYLSGLALTTSPGKVGETFRSVLLIPRGVPLSRSLGAFLADRLSDVLGVCLLGAVAGVLSHGAVNAAGVVLFAVAGASWIFRSIVKRPVLWTSLLSKLPRWGRKPGLLTQDALIAWVHLWRVPNVLFFSAAAALAYGLQAGVFAWFCHLLDIDMGLASAIEIFVNATLLGAASMVPGGLGAMEAALVIQLTSRGVDAAAAISVAIATRFATLWMGVGLGVFALLATTSQWRRAEAA